MTPELVAAIIAGIVAVASALVTITGQRSIERLKADLNELNQQKARSVEREDRIRRYREPLAYAAYELQSRLYNILEQRFVETYYATQSARERSYVVYSTVFLIAQYFAWNEIIRREIQYIDTGRDEETQELARLRNLISSRWRTDRFSPLFRVFAGEQRAIGEIMIENTSRGPECIGYAAFLEFMQEHNEDVLRSLIAPIVEDVRSLSTRLQETRPRLAGIQNALIDLLDILDPKGINFPEQSRRTRAPIEG